MLQGYAALGRLKQGSGAAARAQGVQEALQPLFQAAAALGPRLQYLTSQREAENKRWLQQILHHLQREWTGSTTVEPLEVGTCSDVARCIDPRGTRDDVDVIIFQALFGCLQTCSIYKTASYLTPPHVESYWCCWVCISGCCM